MLRCGRFLSFFLLKDSKNMKKNEGRNKPDGRSRAPLIYEDNGTFCFLLLLFWVQTEGKLFWTFGNR